MREGIGSVFLYNMIILFIIIVFGILSATLSYYKAFKVNERLLFMIDKFEGYNSLSVEEMHNFLKSIGYSSMPGNDPQSQCPESRDGGTLVTSRSARHLYCVYYFSDDRGQNEGGSVNGDREPIYYNYAITTYIYLDLPIVNTIKLPVYTKGERIYNFSDDQRQGVKI